MGMGMGMGMDVRVITDAKDTVQAQAHAIAFVFTMASKTKKKATAKKKTTSPKKKTTSPKKKASSARKAVPKVSPLRGMSIEAFVAKKKLKGWHADALRLIRALVARSAPKATVSIKWGQLVWEQNGPFAWLKPAAKHVSFGFWRGADLSDPNGVLEGSGDRMRHVKLTSAADITELPLETFVKEAASLNASRGDPTKPIAHLKNRRSRSYEA
jgi:hypothetical protein